MIRSPARRVPMLDDLQQPGDYTGPIDVEYPNGEMRNQVLFLLPVHKGADWGDHATPGSGVHGVTEPPWKFRECLDGSLEIRESIACGRGSKSGEYWHGYLDEGNYWRQVLCQSP